MAANLDPSLSWLRAPLLLAPDNFTPLTRTPWGGRVIGERYKKALVPAAAGRAIGESWEFSCDPAFPSTVLKAGDQAGTTLLALIERYPEQILSPGYVAKKGVSCEILVKLLDAAESLSLQVHPTDDNQHLKADECGKPESWLVLQVAPGAGIYLGFSRPVSREALRKALHSGPKAAEYLHFVAVEPGDYFEIQPGVTHAIGAGVTVLEPQRILTGKTGKTYRLWDWDRRYDQSGKLNMAGGEPRPLHIDESLPLIDPEHQVGEAFVQTLRRQAQRTERPGAIVKAFPANPYYQTILLEQAAGSTLPLTITDGYAALLVLSGSITAGGIQLRAGQPALIPHTAFPLTVAADVASTYTLVIPAAATLGF